MEKQFQNILFPTDLSEVSLRALPSVVELARRYQATLHLLHVGDSSIYAYAPYFHVAPGVDIFEGVQKKLNTLELPAEAQELKVERIFRSGTIAEEIAHYIKDGNIDLVVMPSHSRGSVARFFLGSVADRILRTVDAPVLLLREKYDDKGKNAPPSYEAHLRGLQKILIPLDFTATSLLGAKRGVELARDFQANTAFLHVLEKAHSLSEKDNHGARYDHARQELSKAVEALDTTGFESVQEVVVGEPGEVIAKYAEDHDVDLIVAGSKGRAGLGRLILGSVVDSLARQVQCPILIEHPQDK